MKGPLTRSDEDYVAQFPIGCWAFSREHGNPMRVLGAQTVWKHATYLVCPANSVMPIERRGWSRERLQWHKQERIGDLIAAGSDFMVIDEAHRLGASTDTVARYNLGKAQAEAAPYLLLLSATPHQGKTEAFYRLMARLRADEWRHPLAPPTSPV
jgi:hypothetical protein